MKNAQSYYVIRVTGGDTGYSRYVVSVASCGVFSYNHDRQPMKFFSMKEVLLTIANNGRAFGEAEMSIDIDYHVERYDGVVEPVMYVRVPVE